jgi:hypothetical protein
MAAALLTVASALTWLHPWVTSKAVDKKILAATKVQTFMIYSSQKLNDAQQFPTLPTVL